METIMNPPCTAADPEIFFPPPGGDAAAVTAPAKAVCATCPVAAECLGAAMEDERNGGLRYGIWGGLSPVERHRLAEGAA